MSGRRDLAGLHLDARDVFPPLDELMAAWMGGIAEAADETDGAMHVAEIGVDLPVEFQLVMEDGALRLHASPPTQKIETSVLPVWHRLRARYVLED